MRSGLLISQSSNDVAQATQTLIDLFALFESFPSSTGDSDSFTACQVNQIKFSHYNLAWRVFCYWSSIKRVHLLYHNNEHSVRSWRKVVHFGRCCCPWQSSLLHKTVYLIGRPNSPFRKSFYKDSFLLVLSDLQTCPVHLQQVRNNLVIDLQIRRSHHEGGVLILLHLDIPKDFFHTSRNYSPLRISRVVLKAFHGVSLTSTSLTISKNCSVVTF